MTSPWPQWPLPATTRPLVSEQTFQAIPLELDKCPLLAWDTWPESPSWLLWARLIAGPPGNNYTHGRNLMQSNTFQHHGPGEGRGVTESSQRKFPVLVAEAKPLHQSAGSTESSGERRGVRQQRPEGQALLLSCHEISLPDGNFSAPACLAHRWSFQGWWAERSSSFSPSPPAAGRGAGGTCPRLLVAVAVVSICSDLLPNLLDRLPFGEWARNGSRTQRGNVEAQEGPSLCFFIGNVPY